MIATTSNRDCDEGYGGGGGDSSTAVGRSVGERYCPCLSTTNGLLCRAITPSAAESGRREEQGKGGREDDYSEEDDDRVTGLEEGGREEGSQRRRSWQMSERTRNKNNIATVFALCRR